MQALEKLSNIFCERIQKQQNTDKVTWVITESNKVHTSPPRVIQTSKPRTQTQHLIPIELEERTPQQNPD